MVTVLQDTDDQENKVKERKPQPTVHSKAVCLACNVFGAFGL